MSPDDILNMATKLRGRGAKTITITPEGALTVEFEPSKVIQRARRVIASQLSGQQEMFPDAIQREPMLSAGERDAYEDKLNSEYIP